MPPAVAPATFEGEEPPVEEAAGSEPGVRDADLVWKVSTPASPATRGADHDRCPSHGLLLVGADMGVGSLGTLEREGFFVDPPRWQPDPACRGNDAVAEAARPADEEVPVGEVGHQPAQQPIVELHLAARADDLVVVAMMVLDERRQLVAVHDVLWRPMPGR